MRAAAYALPAVMVPAAASTVRISLSSRPIGTSEVARELGVVEQTLHNWMKAHREGRLGHGKGKSKGKPITPEQMEIARLRAENARLKMEAEILKKGSRVLGEFNLLRRPVEFAPRAAGTSGSY